MLRLRRFMFQNVYLGPQVGVVDQARDVRVLAVLLGPGGLRSLAEVSLLTALLQAVPVPGRDFELPFQRERPALIVAADPFEGAVGQPMYINPLLSQTRDIDAGRFN